MTGEMLYLIAHKVRGERAYDVAVSMEVAGEQWWIIPTSGHRAYPFWVTQLGLPDTGPMPADLRDHYAIHDPAPPSPSRSERAETPRLEDL